MVRKKVKKSPARSKKVSNKKEAEVEFSVMSTDDLGSMIRRMINESLAPKDAPAQGEATAPVNQASPAPIAAGQTICKEEANSVPPMKTLPEQLNALRERMMVAFMPEMREIEKRFGYSSFYRALCLQYLCSAVRSMAAAASQDDPRQASGQPMWWDSRDDDVIAEELYSRLASEMASLRNLAKVRKPQAFDARQFSPCFPATNS